MVQNNSFLSYKRSKMFLIWGTKLSDLGAADMGAESSDSLIKKVSGSMFRVRRFWFEMIKYFEWFEIGVQRAPVGRYETLSFTSYDEGLRHPQFALLIHFPFNHAARLIFL